MSRDYSRSVIAVCERISGSVRGSGDPLTRGQLAGDVRWLREQLANWTPSKPETAACDLAVRHLAQAAIELGRSAL